MKRWVVNLMNKEEIKEVITKMFQNLNVDNVESINIDNGTYDDGSTYTQINIDYVKGGENE